MPATSVTGSSGIGVAGPKVVAQSNVNNVLFANASNDLQHIDPNVNVVFLTLKKRR